MKIVLASASPRRQELISLISEDTLCEASGVKEVIPENVPAEEIPLCLARQKALATGAKYPHRVVIGADTAVILQGEILGKPKSRQQAREMLRRLSGKVHKVVTGCFLCQGDRGKGFSSVTEVELYPLTEEEIEDYISTPEPYDKAGGYGIQGRASLFVKRISGDYFNVVGLPVARLYRELNEFAKG